MSSSPKLALWLANQVPLIKWNLELDFHSQEFSLTLQDSSVSYLQQCMIRQEADRSLPLIMFD